VENLNQRVRTDKQFTMRALDRKDLVRVSEVVHALDKHSRLGSDGEVEFQDALVGQLAGTQAGHVIGHVNRITVPVVRPMNESIHHSPILMGRTLTWLK
jgi:hypothetical protein